MGNDRRSDDTGRARHLEFKAPRSCTPLNEGLLAGGEELVELSQVTRRSIRPWMAPTCSMSFCRSKVVFRGAGRGRGDRPGAGGHAAGRGGSDGLKDLRAQTLATRLNVSAGAIDLAAVETELGQADALVGAHAPGGVGLGSTQATDTEMNQLRE